MAGQGEALVALFERSYSMLSPAAQRVYLTLCNWRSSVPALALEAVLLRPENERIDVQNAIEELVQSSFVEEIIDDSTAESEVTIPLSARLFGLRKLEVSMWKASIQADTSLLHWLGARPKVSTAELAPRIRRLFGNAGKAISKGEREFSDIQPVLEFITTRYPLGYVLLADLVAELELDKPDEEYYLLRYLEHPDTDDMPAWRIWQRVAQIRNGHDETNGELHALAQICGLEGTPAYALSNAANRINGILSWISPEQLSRDEKQFIIRDVVTAFEVRVANENDFDATDLSRLAWLQVHLDRMSDALKTVRRGLELDPDNEHCQRLEARLS